ncbi:MAG: NAD(P)(+) transhydrogenase (Re/Si-specific) subunit beta [Flavobacteriales bacterium]|nr:NAD(P)(+) transhydrogenase (Re/Si-specific) subunit beta [Flavobacteriales bacterium]
MELTINSAYLYSALSFILGLKFMGSPSKAKMGNVFAATGMLIAILATSFLVIHQAPKIENIIILILVLLMGAIIGRYMSAKVEMTAMPQLVSLFNALGGLSAFIISLNELYINANNDLTIVFKTVVISGVVLGGASFTGSIIAFYKLSGTLNKGNSTILKRLSQMLLTAILLLSVSIITSPDFSISTVFLIGFIAILSLTYGVLFSMPIGGADMPVLISLLNAVTGIATIFSGVIFNNPIMIVGGVLVGSTGIILTIQMCKAMNRSLKNILFGAQNGAKVITGQREIKIQQTSTVEVSSLLAFSKNVAIIPGYGMAVAQAQQVCYELQKNLMGKDVNITYIIHPVAGRMPGHMNVLLAEANIDYKHIKDMADVNDVMEQFDVAIIIGANDVVNPAAETDVDSPIYGMPIIKAYQAKQVFVMKRSMSTGYSGVENPLFERNNCKVLFGDAKESLTNIIDELKNI